MTTAQMAQTLDQLNEAMKTARTPRPTPPVCTSSCTCCPKGGRR